MYEVCLPPEESESGVEEESEGGEDGLAKGVGTMVKIFHFIMKQSYICALIAMMVSPAARRWRRRARSHRSGRVRVEDLRYFGHYY